MLISPPPERVGSHRIDHMANETSLRKIDPALLERVAGMERAGQRWLRTALLAVTSNDQLIPDQPVQRLAEPGPVTAVEREAAPATLEDVISGKANLRDHLEAFPELSEELDGLAEIIDLLRESGERRRGKGEQILREEILGEEAGADEDYRL